MESTSQQQTQSVTGKAELHASTYDYLAPFDGPNFHSVTDLNHKIAQLRSLGWTADAGASGGSQTAEPLRSLTLSGMAGPLQSLSPGIAFEGKQDGAVLPAGGEKHDIQQKTIEISYSIDWTAQSLSIKLQSRPEDRNYLVYLVVEEQLGVDNLVEKTEQKPQQWLHTAFPMQVVGQLTTVPRSFFDQVTKARQYASKTLSDFAHRYVARAAPRPGEPVSNIGNLQQLSTDKGLLRILKAAEAAAPDLLKKAIQASGKRKRKAAG